MDIEQGLQRLSIQFVPFVMAVVFHEYAHGWVANRYGDSTAKDRGRLTLNPASHVDPVGSIVVPIFSLFAFGGFLGWAKPVPIDPRRFSSYRRGLFWVSAAGPVTNFLLAVLSAALFCVFRRWLPEDFYLFEPLMKMAAASVGVNFMLGLFNLIPLPPLDGSKIVESFLSPRATLAYENLSRFSFVILLAIVFSPVGQYIMVPVRFMTEFTLVLMATLFQIPFI